MNNRSEIQDLAKIRLQEARVLFQNQLYDGCVYMAGYAVELALKVVICKTLEIDNLFDGNFTQAKNFKTHNLSDLLVLSGLYTKIENEKLQNSPFFNQWSNVQSAWSERLRYQSVGTTNRTDAERLLNAIDHPSQGVLQWIQKYW